MDIKKLAMSTKLSRDLGRVFLSEIILLTLGWVTVGCSLPSRATESKSNTIPEKYSIRADRDKLDELRKEVPVEKKISNDESALILGLTTSEDRQPYRVREDWDKIVRKKRESFDKDLKKEREEFSKNEKKSRDEFLAEAKSKRDDFLHTKVTQEKRTQFFQEQDSKRQSYFADERDKRQEFESNMREKRQTFEDYVRSKNNEFNDAYRSYTKRYEEIQRERNQQKTAPKPAMQNPSPGKAVELNEAQKLEQELMDSRKSPSSHLETE